MGYRKRFEDSYLDEEDEEFDGTDRTDAERIIALLEKPVRTPQKDARTKKLTERLFVGAKLPGPPGEQAVYGLRMVAKAYADLSLVDDSAAFWARISDTAGVIGDKNLYYEAMDAMAELSSATYEEHNSGAKE